MNSSLNDATDLDGNPRALPGQLTCGPAGPAVTDIGAYEFVPVAPPCAPRLPPTTTITKTKINRKKNQVTFTFHASGTVSGFECKLLKPRRKHHKRSKAAFSACTSPKTYKHLRPGKYRFEVRAFNSAGVDPTPATKKVKVKPRRA